MKRIRVPGSSANLGSLTILQDHSEFKSVTDCRLGPGFDVFGLALKAKTPSQKFSVCLELEIEPLPQGASAPGNCEIICKGEGAGSFPTAVDENLVTKVALYVLRSNGIKGSVDILDHGCELCFLNM